jgi:hypothetical protein
MSATAVNDAELVDQSLAGHRDAFGQIVARYQSLICSLEDFHKTCSFTFCGRMRRCEYESHTCGDAGTHSEAL